MQFTLTIFDSLFAEIQARSLDVNAYMIYVLQEGLSRTHNSASPAGNAPSDTGLAVREQHETEQTINTSRVQLQQAVEKLAELETVSKSGGVLQKAVSALVGLGIPGLVLLTVMSVSGFVGAAAITSSLAALGGPFGMIGGIATLVALGLASKALTAHGYPVVAGAVIKGLLAKGESRESILERLNQIPSWLLPNHVKAPLLSILNRKA